MMMMVVYKEIYLFINFNVMDVFIIFIILLFI